MTIQVSTVPEVGDRGLSTRIDRAAYLQALLHLRADLDGSIPGLSELRDRATARVQELAIPSTRLEEWRFTDLSPLLQVNFAAADARSTVPATAVDSYLLTETASSRLVFVNGIYQPELSVMTGLPAGAIVGTLSQAGPLQAKLVNYLAQQPGAEETFTALNTASFTDAAIVFVPRNQVIEAPIQLLFVSTSAEQAVLAHTRCLVVAESGSSVTLLEDYISVAEGTVFTNAVTEIWIEENAEVRHTRVQREATTAFHIGKTVVSQARDSRYTCNAISLGAKLSRHNLEVYQTGEQTSTTLNGLTVIGSEQLADTHSTIAFTQPHGTSQQVHKCIASDRAHAVFNGKIFVPKAAQLTNAAQLSRNLLLSPKARVDTKPQLEITADNVKCSHGATVSQLEDDEVFYLQSRGIPAEAARQLLTYAFAIEVINEIPIPSLRNTLAGLIRAESF